MYSIGDMYCTVPYGLALRREPQDSVRRGEDLLILVLFS